MGKSLQTPKDMVRDRSEGLCERCGVELTPNPGGNPILDTARSIHHRQPRRAGGRDTVVCMVNLCICCHKWIHDNEEIAALDGWIIIGRNPANAPFASWRGWVLPDSEGGLALVDWTTGRVVALQTAPARGTTRRARVATRSRPGCRKSRKSPRAA